MGKNDGQACRNGDNCVSGQTVAIIFVPGIMGSRFKIPSKSDAWDPDSTESPSWAHPTNFGNMAHWVTASAATKRKVLDFSNAGEVMLDPHEAFEEPAADRIARGWGGVRWKSYGDFLVSLEGGSFGGASNRTPVYAYGYDWRQPIIQLGCQMAADITGETVKAKVNDGNFEAKPSKRFGGKGILAHAKADKCVIITHSMGGLVTRAALLACASLQSKTYGVLHGVQPATGAPVIYRRFITGVYDPHDGSDDDSKHLATILGNTGDEFSSLASVIPGAMQLLPSELYRQACAGPNSAWLTWTCFEEGRNPTHYADENIHVNYTRSHLDMPPGIIRTTAAKETRDSLATRIDGVKTFHEFIKDWKLPDKTWAFYGNDKNTDTTVRFDLPPKKYAKAHLGLGNYEAKDSSGETVTLDKEKDILRNGFNPTPGGEEKGRGAYGDGTVPAYSGAALFKNFVKLSDLNADTYAFGDNHQFEAGVAHEPAYRDGTIQEFAKAWISYVINRIPRR